MTNYAERHLVVDRFHGDLQWQNFFVSTEPMLTPEFSTDASLIGGGGHYQQDWFYVSWKSNFPQLQSYHINELELFTGVRDQFFLALFFSRHARWNKRKRDYYCELDPWT